jgi:hypothetical protein
MEVFREKSNYEGVLSVYEAMKVRGVTPGAKVIHSSLSSFYFIRINFTHLAHFLFWLKCFTLRSVDWLD